MSKIICIDAGHGGRDPGAVGNGLKEADLTSCIAQGVAQRLEAYACEVHMVPGQRT
ncbi:MAG: N-acetylmuramoyl-L-alanine amidase [Candidatus Syntrophopropionicum ammoniitolerans]